MLSIKKQYHTLKRNQSRNKTTEVSEVLSWIPLSPINFTKLVATTHHYDLYSDFVATNIWAYMGSEALMCFIKEGVAIRMLDDYTQEPYYTLIAKKSARELLDQIISHDNSKAKSIVLRHVPKEATSVLRKDPRVVSIEHDRDNHDYVYSVNKFIKLNTRELRSRRKELNKFRNSFPDTTIVYGLQTNLPLVEDMKKLYLKWVEQTGQKNWEKDYDALLRILKQQTTPQIIVAIYNDKDLIGFTVNELIHKGYYMGFSGKADRQYPGLSIALEHETAKLMKQNYGCAYLNLEQDLGIEGLRNYKLSLAPERLIRKYKITVSTETNKLGI